MTLLEKNVPLRCKVLDLEASGQITYALIKAKPIYTHYSTPKRIIGSQRPRKISSKSYNFFLKRDVLSMPTVAYEYIKNETLLMNVSLIIICNSDNRNQFWNIFDRTTLHNFF